MTTVSNLTQPDDAPATVPDAAVTERAAWVLPVSVIGVVVVLLACAFGAFLIHAYPVLKEPLSMAVGIATLAGLVVSTVVLLHRRR
ncbi:hypothetical protein OG795_33830 (plasmid) [[Kitasatospora] papulosa]|uniref:hypothetical protein n=1 Tax=[Kitasatospora] papulosa TaxID=1464011 RepID=UPI0032484B18